MALHEFAATSRRARSPVLQRASLRFYPVRRCHLLASVFGFTLMVLIGMATAALALANPPVDLSFYVSPNDTDTTAYQLGCNQATADNSTGYPSFVTLDFGSQVADGSGNYLPSTTTEWSTPTVENYALNFAYGYQSCVSGYNNVWLTIGTNNDGSVVDGALGADWGTVVQSIANSASANGYSSVIVLGADDVEAAYSDYSAFNAWEWGDSTGGGYTSTTTAALSDFGDAEGCPQYDTDTNADCGNGYTTEDYWYMNEGWTQNVSNPQIYYNGCSGYANQPVQWADISAWGNAQQGLGPIYFYAPLSQDNCLTPDESYDDLVSALSADGVSYSPFWETEITTQ